MARSPRWETLPVNNGVVEVKLSSWKYFSDYINQELLDYTTYVYRGHGNSAWKLEPTLDRIIKSPTSLERQRHLDNFKYETRGRRGSHPPILEYESDWWALGQHHGLATPLLDWTESPFVGLYFAASVAYTEKHKNYAIFAMSQNAINHKNQHILNNDNIKLINGHKPTVKIVRPQSDENSRLVSQRGLFTRGPNNVDLETWIKMHPNVTSRAMELIKISIPNTTTQDCLRYLNRMNINHSTLFPDLTGASSYCNNHLKINKY